MTQEKLIFQNQTWVPLRRSKLTISLGLPRAASFGKHVDIEAGFVPPWVLEEMRQDEFGRAGEHRMMSLLLSGFIPDMERWQDLAGKVMEHVPMQVEGERIARHGQSGPEVHLFSHNEGGIHDHVPAEVSVSQLVFGEAHRNEDGGDEIEYELEAFYRSARGEREAAKVLPNRVAEFLGSPLPYVIDEELLNDGWTLRHQGRAEFQTVRCHVPMNAPDPAGFAKALARSELGMEGFVRCNVIGSGDASDSTLASRLVVLSVPSDRPRA